MERKDIFPFVVSQFRVKMKINTYKTALVFAFINVLIELVKMKYIHSSVSSSSVID